MATLCVACPLALLLAVASVVRGVITQPFYVFLVRAMFSGALRAGGRAGRGGRGGKGGGGGEGGQMSFPRVGRLDVHISIGGDGAREFEKGEMGWWRLLGGARG